MVCVSILKQINLAGDWEIKKLSASVSHIIINIIHTLFDRQCLVGKNTAVV